MPSKPKKPLMKKKITALPGYKNIHKAVVQLLENARQTTSRSVNTIISATYWEIGRHLIESEQKGAIRAEYGAALIERLSTDLTSRFGRGF